MEINGIIESIEYRNTGGYEKKVVTIESSHNQRSFVEFKGKNMGLLDTYRENDEINVYVELRGTISKNSGVQYNNLIAYKVR